MKDPLSRVEASVKVLFWLVLVNLILNLIVTLVCLMAIGRVNGVATRINAQVSRIEVQIQQISRSALFQ